MSNSNTVQYGNRTIKVSVKDRNTVVELLGSPRTAIAYHGYGIRVEVDQKILSLGAALMPHKNNEVIRPKNGDWFDVRRINLEKVLVNNLK